MPRLPRLTGKELVDILGKAGFEVLRIRGSHSILGHADGRRTVVPLHAGETIGPGLLNQILRDCELTRDQLRSLL
ncbi:MAG: type II toxin-antitoxin system HicA family toxin [Acidobacteriota bacterium]